MRLHVLEGWNSFRAEVIPTDASQVQVREMRRAFYAGAVHIFSLLNESASATQRDEEAWVKFLEDLSGEFRHYREQFRKGLE